MAEEEPGEAVPGEHVQPVVHDQRGRVGDQVEDAQQLRPDPAGGRRPASAALAGEPGEVFAFGPVEAEDPGEGVEDLFGGLGGAALLQAYVVVDADSGEVRDLLAAQSLDPAPAVGGDAHGRRVDPGAPGPQEAREIVHGSEYGCGGRPGGWPCRYQELRSDGSGAPERRARVAPRIRGTDPKEFP